jgi:hypothetical protein
LAFSLITNGGCTKAGNLIKAVAPGKPGPKKRVLVLPLSDRAGLAPQVLDKLNGDFVTLMRASTRLVVSEPTSLFLQGENMKNLSRGAASSSGAVQKAREMGIQTVISGVINAVEISPKKTGIWPFRRSKKAYQISLLADVFDTTTRTLVESSLVQGELLLEVEEGVDHNINEITEQLASEVMPRLIKKQADTVKKRIDALPWAGMILAVTEQGIEITGGEDLGIRNGDLFDVYTEGEEIIAGSGKPVYLMGKRLGTAKVVSVMSDRATAVPVGAASFSEGKVVYYRH